MYNFFVCEPRTDLNYCQTHNHMQWSTIIGEIGDLAVHEVDHIFRIYTRNECEMVPSASLFNST